MRLALVGATGLVGRKMMEILIERGVKPSEFFPVASAKSVGQKIQFNSNTYSICSMEDAIKAKVDVAIFSAGGESSLLWAEKFADSGAFVIDNSSAWRMHRDCPLVVPEVNASSISSDTKIIANPNCSTIQMVLALSGLHRAFQIKRLVISTYQSITGTGKNAVVQMENERKGIDGDKVYPYQIDQNCIPQCDVFLENDYTKEEMKLVHETRKILNQPDIGITATAVRVPVMGGHSEAINVEFHKEYSIDQVRQILSDTSGVQVLDDLKNLDYPMPFYQWEKDDVYVGRIRRDDSQANTLNLWVVADNLRKGAATNAVQILQYLITEKLV